MHFLLYYTDCLDVHLDYFHQNITVSDVHLDYFLSKYDSF